MDFWLVQLYLSSESMSHEATALNSSESLSTVPPLTSLDISALINLEIILAREV
jgi:hypothetical protein